MEIPKGKTVYVGNHVLKEENIVPVSFEEKVKSNLEKSKTPESPKQKVKEKII